MPGAMPCSAAMITYTAMIDAVRRSQTGREAMDMFPSIFTIHRFTAILSRETHSTHQDTV